MKIVVHSCPIIIQAVLGERMKKCVCARLCCPIFKVASTLLHPFPHNAYIKDALTENRAFPSALQYGSTLTLLLPRCSLLRTCVFVHQYLHFLSWKLFPLFRLFFFFLLQRKIFSAFFPFRFRSTINS